METPGAQCPGWLDVNARRAQLDNHQRGSVDGHEEVGAAFRHLDEAKQSARTPVCESDRTCMAVRIERTKRKRDARGASMHLLKQPNSAFGLHPRQRQIG